jgi:hypothetical protein
VRLARGAIVDARVPQVSGNVGRTQYSIEQEEGDDGAAWPGRRADDAMMYSVLAARAGVATASVALLALAALHVLKPEVHPARNMLSQYALGRYGWVMALCFSAFGVASACLSAALAAQVLSLLGRVGLAALVVAAIGLLMAALFPMDPVSTPAAQRSHTGKMHGVAFLVGVPCQLAAVLLLSVTLTSGPSHASLPLLMLAAVVWLSLAVMIGIMLAVGPGKPPSPDGPERFIGWPNRSFMIAYGVWVIVSAWPVAR